ncbi:MAG: cation diffusion facilitator family transporter [Candidatus Promineifilaceae bacterium]|jgi:cation diffusion facilitator family transporter
MMDNEAKNDNHAQTGSAEFAKEKSLTRYAWLSVGAAVVTIALKMSAYLLTGSMGLLSDALEGFINLAAATVVLVTLRIVERPPDETHQYGHDKAEYFSSGIEGTLILIASAAILVTSTQRLLNPQPIEQAGIGLALAIVASIINLVVGQIVLRAGKRYDSITLEADGQHLMSDVWSSAAVVLGVSAAVLTGFERLDPIIAILIGVKIGWEGVKIFRRSIAGLMDSPIAEEERGQVEAILEAHAGSGIRWHALRSRQAGGRRFISVHILVPPEWTVQQAHDLSEELETEVAQAINRATLFTHFEPQGDPSAEQDLALDREFIA